MKTPAETKPRRAVPASGRDCRLIAARQQAFAAFARGLPHRRIEAWHYTDLRSLLREAFPPANVPTAGHLGDVRAKLGPASGVRVVLVDGCYVQGLSTLDDLPSFGVTIASLLDDAPVHSAADCGRRGPGAQRGRPGAQHRLPAGRRVAIAIHAGTDLPRADRDPVGGLG